MLCFIEIDNYLFFYVQFIFSFHREIYLSLILFSFLFSILTIAYFRLFCQAIYMIRFLPLVFTFVYCMYASSTCKNLVKSIINNIQINIPKFN